MLSSRVACNEPDAGSCCDVSPVTNRKLTKPVDGVQAIIRMTPGPSGLVH